jgi:vancomycin aglycone glucosyltransferase
VLALARKMSGRGHEVVVAAPPDFESEVKLRGLKFQPVGRPFRAIMQRATTDAQLLIECLADSEAQYEGLAPLAAECDVILATALQFAARTLAEQHNVAYRYAVFSPMYLRSVTLPSLVLGTRRAPAFVHKAAWALEDRMQLADAGWLRRRRRELGMPEVASLHLHLLGTEPLGAFDAVLSPPPEDGVARLMTGCWRDKGAQLSQYASQFLDEGPAPVYLGFGSMASADFHSTAGALIEAGRRVIALRGWSGIAPPDASHQLMIADEEPHDLLFPRVAVAVHHGGAGTTSAAAAAATPQLIIPHLGDQRYHGLRVEHLGVGMSLPRATDTRAIVEAVAALADDARYRERATEVARRVNLSAGTDRAADVLERAATNHSA